MPGSSWHTARSVFAFALRSAQTSCLGLSRARLLFAFQAFESIGFTLPVIGIVGALANCLFRGLQRVSIAMQSNEHQRFIMPGSGQTGIQLERVFIGVQSLA